MTYLNARAKHVGNDQGDVCEYFQNELVNLVQHNGGDRYFSWKIGEDFPELSILSEVNVSPIAPKTGESAGKVNRDTIRENQCKLQAHQLK